MSNENMVNELDRDTVTFIEWFSLAWSFVWRGLITAIGSMLAGGIVGGMIGFIIGFAASLMGIDVATIKPFITIMGGFIGIFIGICFTVLLIRWVFRARFKRFRLTLVELN